MVLTIARKLAENKHINNAIRKNIYIHSVECSCESKSNIGDKNTIDGRNCYCNVNVDLLGTNKDIRTNIDQPTGQVNVRIDPKNFKALADPKKFE